MRRYENVKIDKLKPYENNARTHSEEQVNKIAKSIEQFGFVNPVLIDGDYGIIAGHGRVMGANQLGMTEVPCIFVEDLTETQKRAYILADNKLALDADWDNDILIGELEALKDLDFDLELTGFEMSIDTEPLFNELEKEEQEKDEKFIIKITFDTYKDWLEKENEIRDIVNNSKARMVVGSVWE